MSFYRRLNVRHSCPLQFRPAGNTLGAWMTVEEWEGIKSDPTQWSEYHVRERMLQAGGPPDAKAD